MNNTSSKVLLREENPANIQPMVWRKFGQPSAAPGLPAGQAARFEPAVSLDHETALLRNRLVEMEQSARQSVEAARRQAFAEGEARGRQQAATELEPVLARMTKSIEEMAALRPQLRDQAESDVVQLSLAIARRILHRELAVDPSAIQALVQVALDRVTRQEVYRVRVHGAQAEAVRVALGAQHSEIEVQTDMRLEPGSLIFETNRGKMDASVTAQLEEIERGLTDRVQQR